MRVLLWGELFWPYLGGAELFAAQLMASLRTRGHEFAVVTSHDSLDLPDRAHYHDIPVYRLPFRAALSPPRIEALEVLRQRVAALHRELAPQLIHLNGVGPNAFFCLHAARVHRTPLLVRLNTDFAPRRRRPAAGTLLEQVLHRATWVTAVSAATLEPALQLVPSIAARSSVIYNGVESSADVPAPPAAAPARILCLGRLVRAKGFDLAIAALPAVLRRRPSARMTIAGDGPERAALQAQAATLGVAAAVEFIGWVAPDAVPRLIASAHLVIVPSRREGLPGVALQAAALGRPVVATPAGGMAEIVEHERTGLLVDRDGHGLAAAITALLDDPARAQRMGHAAWQRARAGFDPERCVNAYDALYRQLGLPQ